MEYIEELIDSGKYENKLEFPSYSGNSKENRKEELRIWWEEEYRLRNLFKYDLETEFDVSENSKKDLLFEIAWSGGHDCGYYEVYYEYKELVNLIK